MLQNQYAYVGLWAAVLVLACEVAPALRAQGTADSGAARDGLLLSISSDKQTYRVGEPVAVTAGFTNIGDIDATFDRYNPAFFFFYKFIVVRTVGLYSAVVPLTEEGKRQTDVHLGRSFFEHKLESRESDETHFKLNEYYNMSAPGVYKILAIAHEATRNSGGTRVEFRSNLLTFTIEKGDPN